MAKQFDLLENLDREGREQYPFLVVLQHDRSSAAGSVIVAPLTVATVALARTRLHPLLTISDQDYVVLMEELAATPRHILGRVVGSAEPNRYAIVSALDLLFTGF